jgi:hypothetical protein
VMDVPKMHWHVITRDVSGGEEDLAFTTRESARYYHDDQQRWYANHPEAEATITYRICLDPRCNATEDGGYGKRQR